MIKPFIETNPCIDEWLAVHHESGKVSRGAFGLFLPNGLCVLGIQVLDHNTPNVALIVWNIAVGFWNDPGEVV